MSAQDRLQEGVLVLRCQVGDREAFAELVGRYHRPLRYFIGQLSDSTEMAEDIEQNTWLTAIEKIGSLRNAGSLTPWLYRIARNAAYQQLRKKRKPVEFRDDLMPSEESHEAEFSPKDAARIHAELKRLSPEHREVMTLRFLEELSYEQVAEVVGCGVNTVKSRIHYAKLALKKALEESHGKK